MKTPKEANAQCNGRLKASNAERDPEESHFKCLRYRGIMYKVHRSGVGFQDVQRRKRTRKCNQSQFFKEDN